MSHRTSRVTLTLTLDVTFEADADDLSDGQVEQIGREQLHALVKTAMNRGLLTGDTPLTVDRYREAVTMTPDQVIR